MFAVLVAIAMLAAACAPAATPAPVEVVKTVQGVVTQMVAGTPQVETKIITATPEAKPTSLPAGSVTINGAVATFLLPIYTE